MVGRQAWTAGVAERGLMQRSQLYVNVIGAVFSWCVTAVLVVLLYVPGLILALLIKIIPERNHRGLRDQGRKL